MHFKFMKHILFLLNSTSHFITLIPNYLMNLIGKDPHIRPSLYYLSCPYSTANDNAVCPIASVPNIGTPL